ncbi:DUF4143 domain-containing protein [Bifidobacterium longum]|uniref:DUF4143 domain-containing protein n=1 Tax=Bifidobacterium longum TaxID=216816 RepID=UPI0032DE99FF
MPVPTTIAAYDAFILYPAHRYDIKGKRILKQEKKYYAVDLGMRRILCSNNVRDIGRLLENVVFLELMRREGDVYVGQSSGSEIDFVTNGPGGRRYYQVSESVHDSATLDDERPYSHEGIRQIYALDWLLNEDHKKQ